MKKRKPTAIIGCEYSGRLRDALVNNHGWDCVSVDLLPSEGDPKNKHHQGDLQEFLSRNHHYDLGIFFPSCQHLCGAGAKYWKQKRESGVQQEAIAFVEMIWDSPNVDRIVIENPVGCLPKRSKKLGKASQIVHPYYFTESEDDMYQKRTCLWVKGDLPLLTPTNKVDISNLPDSKRHKIWHMSPSPDRAKKRSLTPQGLANAMAAQYTEACRHLFN
jgi:hypothetical protein